MENASPYKTAAELGISERERGALIGISRLLANEECSDFDMCKWETCIYGQCRRHFGVHINQVGPVTAPLFLGHSKYWERSGTLNRTQAQAAVAVQNFLLGVELTPVCAKVSEEGAAAQPVAEPRGVLAQLREFFAFA